MVCRAMKKFKSKRVHACGSFQRVGCHGARSPAADPSTRFLNPRCTRIHPKLFCRCHPAPASRALRWRPAPSLEFFPGGRLPCGCSTVRPIRAGHRRRRIRDVQFSARLKSTPHCGPGTLWFCSFFLWPYDPAIGNPVRASSRYPRFPSSERATPSPTYRM